MIKKFNIIIAGAGGIGQGLGLILHELADFDSDIWIGDRNFELATQAANWILKDSERIGRVIPFQMSESGTNEEMKKVFSNSEIVLDCLPGKEAPRIAQLAMDYKLHYANLTEYVAETNQIKEIAKNAEKGFILQTGLAPGYINILAHKLFMDFCSENKVHKVRNIAMKVGGLTKNAVAPHFYGITWSSIGVATEYLEEAIVVRNGEMKKLPSLSERKTIIIDGIHYEEDLTSGGAADLPEALAGKAENLDYKTLRFPGHFDWVKSVISDEPRSKELIKKLEGEMIRQVPMVEDDVVVIYASVDGLDHQGKYRMKEKSLLIKPMTIGNKHLRAIQSTTASAIAEAARILLRGRYKGITLQSQIDPHEFMDGLFVSKIYS